MKKLFANIFRFSFYSLFLLGFTWVSSQLFFEDETRDFLASVTETDNVGAFSLDELKLVYAVEPLSLEPTMMGADSRKALINIYESLVAFDRDLNPSPSLALSWGLIDDFTWEFKLRPGVKFHDGSSFDVEDVVASFDRAFAYSDSEVRSYLDSIASYSAVDEETFRITTHKPDPLLLKKASYVLILPEEYAYEEDDLENPIGSAAYQFKDWIEGDSLYFEAFVDYWGNLPSYKEVEMIFRINKIDRVNLLLTDEAHFLGFVPFDAVEVMIEKGLTVTSIPSLEVQFLLFNFDSEYFRELKNREAVNMAIDQEAFTEIVGGFARPVNQFVSNGVFGFAPGVEANVYDSGAAAEVFEETGMRGETIQFHLPIGLDALGEHVRLHLADAGVNVVVSYLEMDKLLESVEMGKADLYFFGFKSDSGDALDFFNVVVKTGADFNAARYSASDVDLLIEEAATSMNVKTRIEKLHHLMELVVNRDRIGVPLFEYETLYSFIPELTFDPRVDGFIYFDDIKIKE